ncbi:TonB family protein [Duganella sp. Root1480D1]|uniref:TonB family protein n=1 Tax=Duganella sp. Root1480D1 TaxID=1736471 RepID=UPI00070D4E21|nr:TonB family protein [Duganella sp. Root1480D1]KQZ34270.1 hypothetical protein ASD58_28775 [Duganella sp. Root1480D1]
MRDTFPFLVRLGLDASADAKDIRRAYARELKKIDQEATPSAFQELRESYEIALQWHEHHRPEQEIDAHAEPAPEPVPEPAVQNKQEQVLDDPYQLANQAFEKFSSQAADLVERGPAHLPASWKRLLQGGLNDDTLLNLTARTLFEDRIAHLLASGWKPGHEALFVVACEVFDWALDSRRILQFGETGAKINDAINEWKLFEALHPNAYSTFDQLIRFVRETPEPERMAGRKDLMVFHQFAGRFNNWLDLIIDREILEKWGYAVQAELERSGPEPATPVEYMEAAPPPKKNASSWEWNSARNWPLIFVIFALIRGFAAFLNAPHEPTHAGPPPARPQAAMPEKGPSQERINEIASRIDYKWPRNTVNGEYLVSYDVFIDADGAVLGMNLLRSSGNKDYDEAVKKAIRETKPFPPGTKTRFNLRYWVNIKRDPEPKGKPPTEAQFRALQDEIFYVPGSAVQAGELKVSYEVELNDKGKVIKLKKVQASRDPAFDEVVADALRATKAFPAGTQRKFSMVYSRNVGKL